jgi:hypothetical protein
MLPNGLTRKPAMPRGANTLSKVSELFNPITGEWDEQLIAETFWPEDAIEILRIPIADNLEDWLAWYFDTKSLFSVKSAYKVAVAKRDRLPGLDTSTSRSGSDNKNQFEWYKIWQLKVPNKVKIFMWRFAHNSLPTRRNLVRHGIDIDYKMSHLQKV